jgi:hypothetical protein
MRFLSLARAVELGIAQDMARELLSVLMGWAGRIPLIVETGVLPGRTTIGATGWDQERSSYLIRLRSDAHWPILAHEMGHVQHDHVGIGWPTDFTRDRDEIYDELFEQVEALDPSAVARVREEIRWLTFSIETQADDARDKILPLLWDAARARGWYLDMQGG